MRRQLGEVSSKALYDLPATGQAAEPKPQAVVVGTARRAVTARIQRAERKRAEGILKNVRTTTHVVSTAMIQIKTTAEY